jgi:hypothetical protein
MVRFTEVMDDCAALSGAAPRRDERFIADAVKYRKVLEKFPLRRDDLKRNERPKPLVKPKIRRIY